MATNHNRILYKGYVYTLLGKQKADEMVVGLKRQCQKWKDYSKRLTEVLSMGCE